MRRSKLVTQKQISILAVDDDPIITETIQDYFRRSGYDVDVEQNPVNAIERVREGSYDILLLDFLMTPICGDQVVEEIRGFNKDLFIVLLTGHKSMAPPVKTIRQLDIQGYYEKDDRFDQLELLVESCVKSIKQLRRIRDYEKNLSTVVNELPEIYRLGDSADIAKNALSVAGKITGTEKSFIKIYAPDTVYLSKGNLMPEETVAVLGNAEWNTNTAKSGNMLLFKIFGENNEELGVIAYEPAEGEDTGKADLVSILARQTGAALSNAKLHRFVNDRNVRLTEAYMQTIETLRYVVETKDKETRGHSERVSLLASAIAAEMGMNEDEVETIRVAGLFHDIGKVGVPDAILLKNGPLTGEEFGEIKKHPAEGEKILSTYAPLKRTLQIIRSHHERFDGNGYPDRLAGDSICIGARITTVADSFDAMISNRTYRRGLKFEDAISEIVKGKGAQFDPEVADSFLRMIEHMGEEAFKERFCSHT